MKHQSPLSTLATIRKMNLANHRFASVILSSAVLTTLGFVPLLPGQAVTYDGQTDANWSTATNWDTNVEPTAADNVIFPGTIPAPGGAVLIMSAGEVANSLQFDNAYTLGAVLNQGTLTITSGNVTVGAGFNATLNTALQGAAVLTKNGAGTLTLANTNAANNFTGNILVNAGTLAYTGSGTASQQALGSGANKTITVTNGSTVKPLTTSNPGAGNQNFVIGAGGGTIEVGTGVTLTLDDANQFSGAGDLTVSGAGGTNGLVLLTTQAFNAYTGNTIITNGGTLRLGNTNSLGSTVGRTVTVNNTGALDIIAANIPLATITISGTGPAAATPTGALFASSGTGSTAASIVLAADSSIGGAGALNLSGPVSGGFNLTKVGTGVTTLSGANTYTGATTINTGVLQFGSPGSIGGTGESVTVAAGAAAAAGFAIDQAFLDRIVNSSAGAVALGGVNSANDLDFNAAGLTAASLGSTGTASYTGTLTPNGTTYRLGGGNGTLTLSNTNALTGTNSLSVNTGGTTVLGSTNNYTGATAINTGGTLVVAPNAGIATSAVTVNSGGTLQIGNGGTTGSFGAGAIVNNGTLRFNRSDNFTFGPGVTGGGTIIQAGVSTLSINNANTMNGLGFNNSGRVDLLGVNRTITGANIIQMNTAGYSSVFSSGGAAISLGTADGDVGAVANGTVAISSVIQNGAANSVDIFNAGLGTVIFTGANTYTGSTDIQSGTLVAGSLNRVAGGTASSNLGAPTTVANGTINISGNAASTLRYVGTGETTDRVINLQGATAGVTLDQSGTGTLAFETAFTASGSGAKTLTLTGSTSGAGLISGAIPNSAGGSTALTKTGSGTWTLAGANTFTGLTTVNGGTLALDFNPVTAPAANIVAAASPLALSGGALSLNGRAGAANAQTFASTAVNQGGSAVRLAGNGAASLGLSLGAITRATANGGTVDFTLPAGAQTVANGIATTSANNASGILGGYATVGGTDFAANNGSGNVVAYTAYNPVVPTAGGSATTNYALNTGLALTGAAAYNAIKITDPAAGDTLALGANTATIGGAGGGILYTGNSAYNITGAAATSGVLTAGANDLILNTAGTGTLNVSAQITGTGGLTKSGSGTLILTNSSNTFTGNVNVNGGVLAFAGQGGAVGDPNSLGGGTKSIILTNGAVARPTSNSNPTNTNIKSFVIGNGGGGFDVGPNITFILDDATQFTGGGDLTITGSGSGLVSLTAQNFSGFTGNVNVNGGTLRLGNTNSLGNTAGKTVTVNNGGTLDVNAANITQALVLNGTGLTGAGALTNSSAIAATLNGPVTLGSDSSIGGVGTGNIIINGPVSGAPALTKVGPNVVTLSGVNTFTGPVTVSNGTLRAGASSIPGFSGVFGNNSAYTLANVATASLDLNNFDAALGSLAGGGAAGGNVTLGAGTLTTGGNNTSPAAYAGVISGSGGVTKIGTGTQILSGDNSYTGPTNVSGGSLLVNGNQLAATGVVSVASSATLGGSGTIGSDVNVLGILSPGNSPGILTVNGDVIFGAGSSLNIEINGGVAGLGYDQLQITGGGSQFSLNADNNLNLALDPNFTPLLGSIYNLASVQGGAANPILGVFESLNGAPINLGEGSSFMLGGNTFQLTYLAEGNAFSGGNDFALRVTQVVPEPGRALLLLAALPLLMRRRRRHN